MKVRELRKILDREEISDDAEVYLGIFEFQKKDEVIPIELANKYDYCEQTDPVSRKKIKHFSLFAYASKNPRFLTEGIINY